MNTKYELIRPPHPLRFREMTREQAKENFRWFQEQIPTRIQTLNIFVRSYPQYRNWEADFSPTSLGRLGLWFCDLVTTRQRSNLEIESIYSKAPDWFSSIQIPDYDLSTFTVSLSIDIGMYLSQVIVHNVEGLHWEMITKPKKHVDFQQPVLIGAGKIEFNPVHIVLTYAYGIANGTKGPNRLRELYDIWASNLQ